MTSKPTVHIIRHHRLNNDCDSPDNGRSKKNKKSVRPRPLRRRVRQFLVEGMIGLDNDCDGPGVAIAPCHPTLEKADCRDNDCDGRPYGAARRIAFV